MGKDHGRYEHGGFCIGAPDALRKAANREKSRKCRAKQARLK